MQVINIARRVLERLLGLALALGVCATVGATAAAQQSTTPAISRIAGVVFDSTSGEMLALPIVQLVSADDPSLAARAVHGDSAGNFAFDSVTAGRYFATFVHMRLDELNITAPTYLLDLKEAGEVRFEMAVPSAATLHDRYCGARAPFDSTAVLIGRVVENDGVPVDGARVVARWVEVFQTPQGRWESVRQAGGRADVAGWFSICGLPVGSEVKLRVSSGDDSTGFVPVALPRSRLGIERLQLGASPADASRLSITLSASRTGAPRTGTPPHRRR